ncbi:MbtH domain protein [Nostocales cyanobacterium HT-58-2]|nr:MbtH domain protein [Nostocales cyanobacterium HT-58-2]
MNELVQRLSEGNHPVEVSLRPEKTAAALKESIDRGYVHIKFTNTKGGTDLGVRLDPETSNLKDADFEHQTGKVYLVGNLTLNYVKVRCIADIDLANLEGQGHLELVEQ